MVPLTPLDIHNKEFRKTLRGYSENEVDEFLDEVIRDFENLIKENTLLKDELSEARGRLDQYKNLENTLNNTLILAQGTADELRTNARREADLIVQEARAEADRIIVAKQEKAREVQQKIEELHRQLAMFRARGRSMVLAQLELLDQAEREDLAEQTA